MGSGILLRKSNPPAEQSAGHARAVTEELLRRNLQVDCLEIPSQYPSLVEADHIVPFSISTLTFYSGGLIVI